MGNMKVLITGGCSDIGTSLSERLVSTGCQVTIFDKKKPSSKKKGIDFIQGDIRDFHTVSSAAKGCNAGIHLAALSGEVADSEILSVNVIGVCSFLLAARKGRISKLHHRGLCSSASNGKGSGRQLSFTI